VARRTLALGVMLAALTGCGGTSVQTPERQWTANVAGLIDQLRNDVVLSADGSGDVASARRALHDDSDLYDLVLAYSDFGGCDHMLANAGVASARFARVVATLGAACSRLQHAATLFSRAASGNDPQALLAASREAGRASPSLVRAALELRISSR
jgi:hypothetical protein